MATIYLVRHAEVHNPDDLIYGRLPGFGLTALGKKQADLLGRRLRRRNIRAIYSSPLTRAKETAEGLIRYFPSLQVTTDDRLIEVLSPTDGKPNSIMAKSKWNFYTPTLIEQGGERLSDIWKRMQLFLWDTARKHGKEEVVAISHGDPIMIVRAKGRGKPLGISHIRGDGYVSHTSGLLLTVTGKNIEVVSDF